MSSITHGSPHRSQRVVTCATIAGLHAAVIALIVSGFGRIAVDALMGSSVATIIDRPNEDVPQPPPPATPDYVQPAIDLGPAPDLDFEYSDPGTGTAITGETTNIPTPPVVVTTPVVLPIRLVGQHRLPNTDDYYPPPAIRGGIEGASVVRVCVDANGKRTGDPVLQTSSGDASLDRGALHVVRDGRYARSMQGDQYVPNCYAFKIIFKVRN